MLQLCMNNDNIAEESTSSIGIGAGRLGAKVMLTDG